MPQFALGSPACISAAPSTLYISSAPVFAGLRSLDGPPEQQPGLGAVFEEGWETAGSGVRQVPCFEKEINGPEQQEELV